MPAGFTDKENKRIKEALIDEGIRLFSLYGLRKTTIKDITKAVGIAQGSFYKFYDSKEELYFEVLDVESQKVRKELARDLELIECNPRVGLKNVLLKTYQTLEENNLFRDITTGNSYEILLRKLPEEMIEEHIETDFEVITPLIKKWQNDGILKKVKPETITGLLYSLFYISLHKKDIGESVYDDSFKLLVDLIVDGLVKGEGK